MCNMSRNQLSSAGPTGDADDSPKKLTSSMLPSNTTTPIIERFKNVNVKPDFHHYLGIMGSFFVTILVAVASITTTVSESPENCNSLSEGYNPWTSIGCFSVLVVILNKGWQHHLSRAVLRMKAGFDKVSSSENLKIEISSTIKRISSKQCWEGFHHKKSSHEERHVMALSASEPFVPIDVIAELTLVDVTTIFQYAMDKKYVPQEPTQSSPYLKQVLSAMDAAVCMSSSRDGIDVAPCTVESTPPASFTDACALRFCAAVRIFGEWRLVRQVPDGYKGYAVGMNLGRRDIVQNLGKIEHAVHLWMGSQQAIQEDKPSDCANQTCRSPTLRELLQYEVDMRVHPKLPRLKEKTAAIGLVWIHRQLNYQTCIYANIIRVPEAYETTRDAVAAAYKQVYDKYHGWAVQKIFNYSFQGAPPAEEIYKYMNPSLLEEVTNKAKKEKQSGRQRFLSAGETFSTASCSSITDDDESFQISDKANIHGDDDWEIIPNITDSSFISCSSVEDEEGEIWMDTTDHARKHKNPIEEFGSNIAQEWNKFGKNVERGWTEFLSFFVRVFDPNEGHHRGIPLCHLSQEAKKLPLISSAGCLVDNRNNMSLDEGFEEHDNDETSIISMEMTKHAHRQMNAYLGVMQPLMADLEELVEDLNMNDPSRV